PPLLFLAFGPVLVFFALMMHLPKWIRWFGCHRQATGNDPRAGNQLPRGPTQIKVIPTRIVLILGTPRQVQTSGNSTDSLADCLELCGKTVLSGHVVTISETMPKGGTHGPACHQRGRGPGADDRRRTANAFRRVIP